MPPARPAANPAAKAAKPRAKPSTKSAAQPAAGQPIPVAPVEHLQLFKVKYSCQKKSTQSLSLPSRQFLGYFVVHMPSCLHVLFCVVRLLHSNGGEGGFTWGMFPRGCGDTIAHRWLLSKRGGDMLLYMLLHLIWHHGAASGSVLIWHCIATTSITQMSCQMQYQK